MHYHLPDVCLRMRLSVCWNLKMFLKLPNVFRNCISLIHCARNKIVLEVWRGRARPDERWFFRRAEQGRQMRGDFSNRRAGPVNERGFFQRTWIQARRKILHVNPGQQIYCLLLLLLNTFPNLHPLFITPTSSYLLWQSLNAYIKIKGNFGRMSSFII